MQRILILLSGRGSNMVALAEACERERWPARLVAVLSNRPDAGGLAWARERGIPAEAIDHKAHATRESFDAALAEAIDAHRPDVIVLAGFMRILTEGFVRRYAGRMLNIHPSLLPAFAGLHTHQRAIEAGVQFAGATVHLVTPELDHGPILAQAAVRVRPDDTEATLAARVLQAEHRLYPQAVRWWVEGKLRLDGERVRHVDGAAQGWLAD